MFNFSILLKVECKFFKWKVFVKEREKGIRICSWNECLLFLVFCYCCKCWCLKYGWYKVDYLYVWWIDIWFLLLSEIIGGSWGFFVW